MFFFGGGYDFFTCIKTTHGYMMKVYYDIGFIFFMSIVSGIPEEEKKCNKQADSKETCIINNDPKQTFLSFHDQALPEGVWRVYGKS